MTAKRHPAEGIWFNTECELIAIRMAKAGLRAHEDGHAFDGALWLDEHLNHPTSVKAYPSTIGRLDSERIRFITLYRRIREEARKNAIHILRAQLDQAEAEAHAGTCTGTEVASR